MLMFLLNSSEKKKEKGNIIFNATKITFQGTGMDISDKYFINRTMNYMNGFT